MAHQGTLLDCLTPLSSRAPSDNNNNINNNSSSHHHQGTLGAADRSLSTSFSRCVVASEDAVDDNTTRIIEGGKENCQSPCAHTYYLFMYTHTHLDTYPISDNESATDSVYILDTTNNTGKLPRDDDDDEQQQQQGQLNRKSSTRRSEEFVPMMTVCGQPSIRCSLSRKCGIPLTVVVVLHHSHDSGEIASCV